MDSGPASSKPGDGRDQARTRHARRAVVDAARELFAERGYGAATVEAISRRADVPAATVYRLFSSKLGILTALLDAAVVGGDDAGDLADQPRAQSLLSGRNGAEQLAGFAAICRETNVRTAALYRVLVDAAATDRDAAALLAERTKRRAAGQRRIARALARQGSLRPDVREGDAADIIHALMSPEVFQLLVGERGWSAERYERWLAGTLRQQLLPAGAGTGD